MQRRNVVDIFSSFWGSNLFAGVGEPRKENINKLREEKQDKRKEKQKREEKGRGEKQSTDLTQGERGTVVIEEKLKAKWCRMRTGNANKERR